MLIILEGARGTGKSSVAYKLRQRLKHSTLINPTGFHEDGEVGLKKISNYYDGMFELFHKWKSKMSGYTTILDRFFPTEMVFSSLYKEYDFHQKFKSLCKLLPTLDDEIYIFFFTVSDKDVLKERLKRDKVPFAQVEESVEESLKQQDSYYKYIDELKRYIDWDCKGSLKLIGIDTAHMNQDEVVDFVFRQIQNVSEGLW
ncbi:MULTISPECIES: hypothetical protein [Bacillus]|uniref:Uncharacterized protein n=2 Tax=Bacillus TaxID=1386 RepID=A0AAJ4D2U3_9BACI|nr:MULTISPECIES: hypothetical protein [Bacillus]EME72232.1 hypothetical protein BSONL12_23080 [Bacillus sonorensis L12]KKB71898.1 hypothetical protein TH62_20050 [Bacillus sp. TH008]MCZ0075443.1 hypothetical protein [Bacillus sonorensis]MCZ0093097.1 hypothetical protein [Bacillus sonorensis]PAD57998.1 hypothetical protein CHH92_22405 [Bacillus sonorensis]